MDRLMLLYWSRLVYLSTTMRSNPGPRLGAQVSFVGSGFYWPASGLKIKVISGGDYSRHKQAVPDDITDNRRSKAFCFYNISELLLTPAQSVFKDILKTSALIEGQSDARD